MRLCDLRDRVLRRGNVIARGGRPIPYKRVKLSGDHALDWTAEDIIHPWPTRVLPPEVVQLAAMLSRFTPERRQVLSESESENGWPAWWGSWVERYGWQDFKAICLDALAFGEQGIPIEASLLASVEESD